MSDADRTLADLLEEVRRGDDDRAVLILHRAPDGPAVDAPGSTATGTGTTRP